MSTLEATVSMIGLLSEEDLKTVQSFIKTTFHIQEQMDMEGNAVTKEKFLEELEFSRRQADEGKCRNAHAVLDDMRSRYVL